MAAVKEKDKKKKDLAIKLVRGPVSATKKQAKVLESLGLGKCNSIVYHDNTATIKGMINKVSHMVEVTENK